MKKKIIAGILGTVLAAGMLAGCGSSSSGTAATAASSAAQTAAAAESTEAETAAQAQTEESTEASADGLLKEIQDKGTLTVAMEGDWQPWSYHDTDSNEVIGYDADVARAIGEKLGVSVEIVEAPWESLFAGLDSGRYDMVVNGVEITDERSEKYDFTEPYGYIRTALVVRNDNTDINSFEDLRGKKTVNSIASTYMTLAESYGATAAGVSTLDETIQNVIDGRADATLNAEDSIYTYMKQKPDAPIKIVAVTDDASKVAIPVRKGEETESFLTALNQALDELRADGTLTELSEKYFGSDISKENAE